MNRTQPNPAPKELQEIDELYSKLIAIEIKLGDPQEQQKQILREYTDRIRADERSRAVPVMDYENEWIELRQIYLHKGNTHAEKWLRSFASRLTSQAGQGWKIEFRNGSLYIGSPEILRGFYTHSIHGDKKWEARYFQWYKKEWGDEDYRGSFNTEEEAQKWLMENALSELTSLRVKESGRTMRDAVIEECACHIDDLFLNLMGDLDKVKPESAKVSNELRVMITPEIRSLRTKPEESEGTK